MNTLKFRITTLLQEQLDLHDDGTQRLSLAEVLAIHKALADEPTPTIDIMLAMIHQQTVYLQHEFDLQSGDESETIQRFLLDFTTHLSRQFLSTAKTYKDGVTLQQIVTPD